MSVQTDADEHRDQAVKHVREALRHLNEIIALECWGHDQYTRDYKNKLLEAHTKLVQIREDL